MLAQALKPQGLKPGFHRQDIRLGVFKSLSSPQTGIKFSHRKSVQDLQLLCDSEHYSYSQQSKGYNLIPNHSMSSFLQIFIATRSKLAWHTAILASRFYMTAFPHDNSMADCAKSLACISRVHLSRASLACISRVHLSRASLVCISRVHLARA